MSDAELEQALADGFGFASLAEFRAWKAAGRPVAWCKRCGKEAWWPHIPKRCGRCGGMIVMERKGE